MIKRMVVCLGAMVLFSQVAFPVGPVVLYTNAVENATVTLSSNISVTNAPTANVNGEVTGIAFNAGVGGGALDGSGNFSVYNIGTVSGGGAQDLFGIYGSSVAVTSYTGNITVVNDRSGLVTTTRYAQAAATGIRGNVIGDITGTISVSATGGHTDTTSATSYGNANATATAYGIDGSVSGDVTGRIIATATGGTANIEEFHVGDGDAAARGINGSVSSNVTGTISATATGGNATLENFGSASAKATAYGIYGSVSGDLIGTITSTATGGTADRGAAATSIGITGWVGGNVAGTISASAIGGTATGSEPSSWAYAKGIGGTVCGDVIGTIAAAATGGTATGYYTAYADADAYGVAGDVLGSVSGTIGATATGGVATSGNGEAWARGSAYAVNGQVAGELTGELSAVAVGGTATGPARADATANAYGTGSSIAGNLSGTIRATATGGTATAISGTAYASADTNTINGSVSSNITGTISATAVGGVAESTSALSLADAEAYGISGTIRDMGGTLSATAIDGTATSYQTAYADADAWAMDGTINGDVTGTIIAAATGGSAISSNATAAADAEAFGVAGGNVNGNVSGTITSTATGGVATATSSSGIAKAYGTAYAIRGKVTGDVAGTLSADSVGGVANSPGSAYAGAEAGGIQDVVIGNVSATIDAIATAGTATSTAYANSWATASGLNDEVTGNFSGDMTVAATGGSATSSGSATTADAKAGADGYGINGDVTGNMTGQINVSADAGTASAASDGANATAYAQVDATAYGINGDVVGDVTGTTEVSATGGLATSVAYNSTANAHAIAAAEVLVRGIRGDVTGDIGTIVATATGGTATATGVYAYARSHATAYGIQGEQTRGDVIGSIDAIATGGTANSTATGSTGSSEASAYAYGIYDEVFIGDMIGSINATATGGTATSSREAIAYARAFGIEGDTVIISNFTGNISATAVAGLETVNVPDNEDPASVSADEEAEVVAFGGMTTVSSANAFGIYAEDSLYLNAPSGSIHAAIDVPAGYDAEDLPEGSAACAICGGTGNDIIRLGNMDIVGDIDLRTGINEIYLFGRTQVKGNVSATDGQNNYSFELYEDEASPLNSKLMVDGTVSEPNGATVAAYAAAGQTAQNIVGHRYEVITADDIAGTFVANDISMFNLAIEQSATNVVITATGVKGQTDASTRVSKTTVHTAQAVMKDLSAHSGAMRFLLRSTAAYGRAPNRPVGPAAERLASGEWLVSVRQVNDLGSQDSDGALAGYDWQSSGFMAGAERRLNPNLVLGATAGGVWSDIDGKEGAGGGASDMFVAGLYGNWFTETLFVEAGFSYAHAWNEEQRIATDNQHYMGDYDSDLYGTWLEAGYTLSGKKCNVEPYFRTSYISGNHDGYTDGGGTNPMKVNANNTDNWLTETGLRTSRNWELQNGDLFGIELKAAWQHELLDTSVSANASLLGTDQTLNSPASDRNALALGIKAEWKTSDAITLGVEYAPTVAGNWYSHYIAAALKYEF